ncbi:MAG TPA: ATP-binding cassette domain-containing protein [Burkholderiaceae bacterium]
MNARTATALADWRALRPVLALFWTGPRRLLVLGMVLAAAAVLAGVALLGLSGWFITATALAGLSASAALAFDVFAPGAAIRLLALLRTGGRYGERLVTHDATLRVLAALREQLFRGWAMPGAARQLAARPAKLLFRLTADVDALDVLYLRVLVPAGAALLTALAVGLAVGLGLNPWVGAGLAVVLVLASVGILLWAALRGLRPARSRAWASEALRERCIDLVAGQTDLALAGRLAAQRVALGDAERRLAQADDQLHRIETRAGAAYGLLSAALLAGTLLAAGWLAQAGRVGAPMAALALLLALAATEPFSALRRGALELGRTLLAARRLGPRLRESTMSVEWDETPVDASLVLQLRDAVAGHDDAVAPQLRGISLALGRGERVALIGPSGAGKSTLLALVAGELALHTGMCAAQPHCLLPQRTELFQDTLRDNLLLANVDADDARLWQVLAEAGLEADIRALPLGLNTQLGEGGLGLSGGQSRRLALARLLLRPVPLWLLDEPTDGLDAATARDVLDCLDTQAREQGRALLLATHLQREARLADRLLLIEHGCVAREARRGDADYAALLGALRPD